MESLESPTVLPRAEDEDNVLGFTDDQVFYCPYMYFSIIYSFHDSVFCLSFLYHDHASFDRFEFEYRFACLHVYASFTITNTCHSGTGLNGSDRCKISMMRARHFIW